MIHKLATNLLIAAVLLIVFDIMLMAVVGSALRHPLLLPWKILYLTLMSFFGLAAVPMWTSAIKLWKSARDVSRHSRLTIGLLGLVVITGFGIVEFWSDLIVPLSSGGLRDLRAAVTLQMIVSFVSVGIPAVIEAMLIQGQLEQMRGNGIFRNYVGRFLSIRDLLERSTTFFAFAVVGTVLTFTALRLAAGLEHVNSRVPSEILLVFGFYGSFILAVVYIPVYLSLLAAGRRLRDNALTPLPYTPIKPWVDDRTSLDKVLGLEAGGIGSVKIAVTILTPLLGSIITGLLGQKSGQ